MGCGSSAPVTADTIGATSASSAPAGANRSQDAAAAPAGKAGDRKSVGAKAVTPGSGPKPKKITDSYELAEVIGKGGFGEVKRAKRRADGKIVAIKVMSKLQFKTEQDHKDMLTEVELFAKVKGHPNVIEMFEWMEDRKGFWIVSELATGGELMERIIKSPQFSEKDASKYFRQMCESVKWCHEHQVVHRDLKPENFLLKTPSADSDLTLTDFGLSCFIETPDSVITDACGSAYYIAPEVFTRQYTKAADVWSLGVILFLFLSGTVPFGGNAATESDVYKAIQREELSLASPAWQRISAAARELVSGLLEKDPAKRYTLEQALAHPWVRGEAAPATPLASGLITSLLAFNARNKFRKMAMELVASTMSAAAVAELRTAFHKIDTDNSGVITYAEMARALKDMGVSEDVITPMMRNLDTNGDGKISWQEFLSATADRQLIQNQNAIWWAFCEYDRNGDGNITVDELKQVLKGESDEVIQKYIQEYDLNKDGMISYEEFMRMLLPSTGIKYKISAAT